MSSTMAIALCSMLAVTSVSAARHALAVKSARHLTSCGVGCSALMGSSANFGVLAYSTVTNNAYTIITGDLGLTPGSSITGFPPGAYTGTLYVDDSMAIKAQSDAQIGFNSLISMAPTANLTGQDLGNMTLSPGKYIFATVAQLTGNLTLDAGGDATAIFVITTGTSFTTSVESNIILLNGAQACNVFYAVGSSASIGSASDFQGTIVAYQSVVLFHATTVQGSVVGLGAAVTLDTNMVNALGACA